jgi:hypothetical protein
MARVEGINRVHRMLDKKLKQVEKTRSVIVGFTQAYAIYVHENLEAKHDNGQAKFLEAPARELSSTFVDIIATAMRKGRTLEQGLLLAGLRLQREAQIRCPVETGALKGSAFTRYDE